MIHTNNLQELIFNHSPENLDELVIVSGYVGMGPVQMIAKKEHAVKIVYGMMPSDGVSDVLHKSLKHLDETSTNAQIFYKKTKPVHSKCYAWRKDGKIISALIGSANFSNNGLNSPFKEILTTVDEKDFTDLNNYLNEVMADSERCAGAVVTGRIKKHKLVAVETRIPIPAAISTTLRFSLLTAQGKIPSGSGINWGHGDSHTHRNDAYIRIPKDVIKFHPGFFNSKAEGEKVPLDILWDDGEVMQGLAEGNQEFEGQVYPKQLSSFPEKKIMGSYLRRRMGIASESEVTAADFRNYGRDYIDITFTGPNSYYLDFSKPK